MTQAAAGSGLRTSGLGQSGAEIRTEGLRNTYKSSRGDVAAVRGMVRETDLSTLIAG